MALNYNNKLKLAQRLSMLYTNYEALNSIYQRLLTNNWDETLKVSQYGRINVSNYKVVGSPTISTGIASGFSSTSYIDTERTIDTTGSWEISTKITTGTNVSTLQNIEGCTSSAYGALLCLGTDHKLRLKLSSDGSTWDIGTLTGATVLTASTTYWIKYGWNEEIYYIKISTDGETYTTDTILDADELVHSHSIYLGTTFDLTNSFLGSIDLNNYKITIEDELVYVANYNESEATNIKVVGTPTIMDGIAKNFNTGYYITNMHSISIDNPTLITYKGQATYSSDSNSANSYKVFLDSGISSLRFSISADGTKLQVLNLESYSPSYDLVSTLTDGEEFYFEFQIKEKEQRFIIKSLTSTLLDVTETRYEFTMPTTSIENVGLGGFASSTYFWTGSIDLRKFQILANNKLVYYTIDLNRLIPNLNLDLNNSILHGEIAPNNHITGTANQLYIDTNTKYLYVCLADGNSNWLNILDDANLDMHDSDPEAHSAIIARAEGNSTLQFKVSDVDTGSVGNYIVLGSAKIDKDWVASNFSGSSYLKTSINPIQTATNYEIDIKFKLPSTISASRTEYILADYKGLTGLSIYYDSTGVYVRAGSNVTLLDEVNADDVWKIILRYSSTSCKAVYTVNDGEETTETINITGYSAYTNNYLYLGIKYGTSAIDTDSYFSGSIYLEDFIIYSGGSIVFSPYPQHNIDSSYQTVNKKYIGETSNLETTDNSSLTSAINELYSRTLDVNTAIDNFNISEKYSVVSGNLTNGDADLIDATTSTVAQNTVVNTYYYNMEANTSAVIELVGGGGCAAYTDGGRDAYGDTNYAYHYYHNGGAGGYFKGTFSTTVAGVLKMNVPSGANYRKNIYDTYSYPSDGDGEDAVATFTPTGGTEVEVARARGGARGYPPFSSGFWASVAGGSVTYNTDYITNVDKAVKGTNGTVYSSFYI